MSSSSELQVTDENFHNSHFFLNNLKYENAALNEILWFDDCIPN